MIQAAVASRRPIISWCFANEGKTKYRSRTPRGFMNMRVNARSRRSSCNIEGGKENKLRTDSLTGFGVNTRVHSGMTSGLIVYCLIRQYTINPDVIPECTRVLTPNPVRESVLSLFSFPPSILHELRRDLAFTRIFMKPRGVRDRYFVFPSFAKHHEIIGRRDATAA